MQRHLLNKLRLIMFTVGFIFLTSPPSHASDITGYDELIKLFASELSIDEQTDFKKSLQNADDEAFSQILKKELRSTLAERQHILRQSESIPTKIFKIGEEYAVIGFEKALNYKGGWQKGAYMLLFQIKGPQDMSYADNYLFWKGSRKSVQEYYDIADDDICTKFSILTQTAECGGSKTEELAEAKIEEQVTAPAKAKAPEEPQKQKEIQTTEKTKNEVAQLESSINLKISALDTELQQINSSLLKKANREHTHNGRDIDAGIIMENFIDASIARDREFTNSPVKISAGDPDDTYVKNLENRIMDLENTVRKLSALLEGVSRDQDTVLFSGVNVQIVNGTGSTGGRVNGNGNLIVGYNQTRDGSDEIERTGSHNIIVGDGHDYTSYGGLVAGLSNTISGAYSTVTGGLRNTASGDYSAVSGGHFKSAEGLYAISEPDVKAPQKEEKEAKGCFISLLTGQHSAPRDESTKIAEEEKEVEFFGGCGGN